MMRLVCLGMQGGLPELCKHKYGRRVLLQLLRPNAQKYVPMNVQKMCQSPAKPASGFEVAADQVCTATHVQDANPL